MNSYTSSDVVLPVFVTVTLIVTFCPALTVVGVIFRSEYLKVVYELHAVMASSYKIHQ